MDPFLADTVCTEVQASLGYTYIRAWEGLFLASPATAIHMDQSWKRVSWENRRQLC